MGRKKLIDVTVDQMHETDLSEIVRIERASFPTPWSETLFYNELRKEQAVIKVARTEIRIAGYIVANQVIDEGHILDLAVDPVFRRLGVASVLVEKIMNHFKENRCRAIFLEVRASSTGARRLYEGFGFSVLGIRKRYYSSPEEDAVIMTVKIDG
ncbi:MAG: ribosomal protein S18-alanine N-acetyltransferase [Nitrospiraceae bacterium]|nr:MAG: ribosomal protein S18-alanine N-acetyltransferase [Nitrospiraceae bacterium]